MALPFCVCSLLLHAGKCCHGNGLIGVTMGATLEFGRELSWLCPLSLVAMAIVMLHTLCYCFVSSLRPL